MGATGQGSCCSAGSGGEGPGGGSQGLCTPEPPPPPPPKEKGVRGRWRLEESYFPPGRGAHYLRGRAGQPGLGRLPIPLLLLLAPPSLLLPLPPFASLSSLSLVSTQGPRGRSRVGELHRAADCSAQDRPAGGGEAVPSAWAGVEGSVLWSGQVPGCGGACTGGGGPLCSPASSPVTWPLPWPPHPVSVSPSAGALGRQLRSLGLCTRPRPSGPPAHLPPTAPLAARV